MIHVDLALSNDGPGAWSISAFTMLLLVAATGIGFRLGRRARRTQDTTEPAVGSIVGATLGLLALIMAFTFGMAGSHYEKRKLLVVEEANAIGTAALR